MATGVDEGLVLLASISGSPDFLGRLGSTLAAAPGLNGLMSGDTVGDADATGFGFALLAVVTVVPCFVDSATAPGFSVSISGEAVAVGDAVPVPVSGALGHPVHPA